MGWHKAKNLLDRRVMRMKILPPYWEEESTRYSSDRR
jgi:hypothetical protein